MSEKRTFGAASRSSPSLRWNSSRYSSGTRPTSRNESTWPIFIAAPFIVPSAATICSAASRWRRSSAACLPFSSRVRFAAWVPSRRVPWPAARPRDARGADDPRGRDAVLGHGVPASGRRARLGRLGRRWPAARRGAAAAGVAVGCRRRGGRRRLRRLRGRRRRLLARRAARPACPRPSSRRVAPACRALPLEPLKNVRLPAATETESPASQLGGGERRAATAAKAISPVASAELPLTPGEPATRWTARGGAVASGSSSSSSVGGGASGSNGSSRRRAGSGTLPRATRGTRHRADGLDRACAAPRTPAPR